MPKVSTIITSTHFPIINAYFEQCLDLYFTSFLKFGCLMVLGIKFFKIWFVNSKCLFWVKITDVEAILFNFELILLSNIWYPFNDDSGQAFDRNLVFFKLLAHLFQFNCFFVCGSLSFFSTRLALSFFVQLIVLILLWKRCSETLKY